MRPINDSKFLIKTNVNLNKNQNNNENEFLLAEEIKMIRINFSAFQIETVYKDLSIEEDLVQFNYDQAANKFIFIFETQVHNKSIYKF